MKSAIKNLHVPLPEPVYRALRAAAKREHRPATAIAREAIGRGLEERRRAALHDAISAYARKAAGTADDLDAGLEEAGLDHLSNPDVTG